MKTFSAILVSCLLCCSCDSSLDPKSSADNPDVWVNNARPPVKVAAIGTEGDVTLQDGNGNIKTFHRRYYFSKAVAGSRKVGDILREDSGGY